jgi:hypothetical protein
MVHVDFVILWKKFLKEYEVQMSNHRSAAAVLFDLEMESNIKTLDRAVKKHFQLDDELLRYLFIIIIIIIIVNYYYLEKHMLMAAILIQFLNHGIEDGVFSSSSVEKITSMT